MTNCDLSHSYVCLPEGKWVANPGGASPVIKWVINGFAVIMPLTIGYYYIKVYHYS